MKPVKGCERLEQKVNAEMRNMKTTQYKGAVDFPEPGVWFKVTGHDYKFDCTGFVKYMLMSEFSGYLPSNWSGQNAQNWQEKHLGFLPWQRTDGSGSHSFNSSGTPEQWVAHAKYLKNQPGMKLPGKSMMMRVLDINKIKPGFILASPPPIDAKPGSHGHVMISMGTVNKNTGALLIADSTSKPIHENDDRKNNKNGMGKGVIHVSTHGQGLRMKWSMTNQPERELYVLQPLV